MIRLVLSDIDGTLVHGEENDLDPRYFEEIRRLRQKGILFAPATGRQYWGVRFLFYPVADEIYAICEDGTNIFSPENGGTLLYTDVLEREKILGLCREAMADPRCEIMVCEPETCYIMQKNEAFADHVNRHDYRRFEVIDDYRQIKGDICKLTIFCKDGLEATHAVEKVLAPKYNDRYHNAIAGDWWLDFTVSDKGSCAKKLCELLGIAPEEVIAFGDNYNDVPMLQFAGQAYIMDNAEPALKDMFPNHCSNVLDVLKTL